MSEQKKTTAAVATIDKEKDLETNRGFGSKVTPVLIEAEKMFEKLAHITKETAQKAFERFQKRGGGSGKELDDWFSAEANVLRPVSVEIVESDRAINVKAAIPGFKLEEIEISLKDDLLMLSGETEKHQEKQDENVFYSEWQSNRFFRQLLLPCPVDAENVRAELKDGILTLSLPKAATEEPKQIAVKVG